MSPKLTRLLSLIDSRLEAVPLLLDGLFPVFSQAWIEATRTQGEAKAAPAIPPSPPRSPTASPLTSLGAISGLGTPCLTQVGK